ncbi:GLPGLI family protein [Flavobacterium ardleyense]|uniref:GLPGLI family protein n=1 Tax=Flavobacterium ardleyense TaxID=2038737 RepID=A0ABW5Z882_9FLAO
MKKITPIIAILALSFSSISISQTNNINIVNYKIVEMNGKSSQRFNSENLEFELLYDADKSLFQLVDKLDEKENIIDSKIIKVIYGGHIKYYKDNLKQEKLMTVDDEGIIYNVVTDFNEYTWEIDPNETKEISGFKCYKATTRKERKHNGIIKETFQPFAWFTYEIPTSYGPVGLDGLPGLVLEGSFDGKKIFYATHTSKANRDIQKPKTNKTVSFDAYSNKMYDQTDDRNKFQEENKQEIERGKTQLKR